MTDTGPTEALDTEQCHYCPKTYTGPAGRKGPGSALFKRLSHEARSHKVKAPGSSRRSAKARDDDAHPVLAVVGDMADDVTGKGVPTEDQLTRAFGRGLGVVSLAVASWAVETDPRPLSESQKDEIEQWLTLAPQAATDVVQPIGRMFHRTSLNRRYGRQIVDNVDVVGAIADVALLALRWKRYISSRQAFDLAAPPPGVGVPAPGEYVPQVPVPSPAPGGQALGPEPVLVTANGSDPQAGRVLTYEDVQAMRRGQ